MELMIQIISVLSSIKEKKKSESNWMTFKVMKETLKSVNLEFYFS